MQKLSVHCFIDPSVLHRKVKVYDVKSKELIGEFETIKAASKFTGVPRTQIPQLIKKKGKNRKNSLGKILAFR